MSSDSQQSESALPSDHNSPSPPSPIPLQWPPDANLTEEWVHNFMSLLDWSSKHLPPADLPTVLPVNVFDSLILTASKLLHKEPNCVQITDGLDHDSVVVVVGDVHGQLHDTLFLLKDAGFPANNRFFVFNGDYVDRGAWGLETFLILLAWKVYLFTPLCFGFTEFCGFCLCWLLSVLLRWPSLDI